MRGVAPLKFASAGSSRDTGPVASLRIALIAALLVPAAIALADSVTVPECVTHTKHSSYRGYGYQHAVEVRNGCDAPVECTASADSAPDPITFTVNGGANVTKVLKIGAPGSAFELRLSCEEK